MKKDIIKLTYAIVILRIIAFILYFRIDTIFPFLEYSIRSDIRDVASRMMPTSLLMMLFYSATILAENMLGGSLILVVFACTVIIWNVMMLLPFAGKNPKKRMLFFTLSFVTATWEFAFLLHIFAIWLNNATFSLHGLAFWLFDGEGLIAYGTLFSISTMVLSAISAYLTAKDMRNGDK